MGKGCGLSAGSRYAYSLADACTSDNPFLVWMKLKGSSAFLCLVFTMTMPLLCNASFCSLAPRQCAEGYDPNGSYIGVTAMQIACEIPNADIFLLLLKFGADPEKRTSSRARGVTLSCATYCIVCAGVFQLVAAGLYVPTCHICSALSYIYADAATPFMKLIFALIMDTLRGELFLRRDSTHDMRAPLKRSKGSRKEGKLRAHAALD